MTADKPKIMFWKGKFMNYFIFTILATVLFPIAASASTNTIVLSVGSDVSISKTLAPLKYAERDATKFSDAMRCAALEQSTKKSC